MNITGGKYRGRKLIIPKTQDVRPTSSKVRESIFSMLLAFNLQGACFLDLFAGSGIMGLEAVSRGASEAVFVEKNTKTYLNLKKNLENFDFKNEAIKGDGLKFLEKTAKKFDIIFCDPPYKYNYLEEISQKVKEHNLLSEDGVLIYEADVSLDLTKVIEKEKLELIKEKKYGDTKVYFLKPLLT